MFIALELPLGDHSVGLLQTNQLPIFCFCIPYPTPHNSPNQHRYARKKGTLLGLVFLFQIPYYIFGRHI